MIEQKTKKEFWRQLREITVLVLVAVVIRTFGFGLYKVPTGSMETTMLVGEHFFADKFTVLFSKPKRGEIISFDDPTYIYSPNKIMNLFQHYAWGPNNVTKRVVGTPGDRVQGAVEDGKTAIYINGKKLDEPYLNKYPLVPVGYTWRSYDPSVPFDQQPFYNMNESEVKRYERLMERVGRKPMLLPGTPLSETQCGSDVFDITLGENQYWAMGDNRLGSADSRSWGVLDGSFIHGKIIWRVFSIDSSEGWMIIDMLKHPIDFWKKVRWSRCFQWVQ